MTIASMSARDAVHLLIDLCTRYIAPVAVASEWVLVVFGALVVALAPLGSGKWLRAARGAFRRFANRKTAAIVVSGMLPIALRLAMLPFAPAPDPSIHDEFSHLLLGDTLAHGRLTNPTHPLWRHFESIHIIQRPTYNSMYPPGQGSFLALGEIVFHEPWAGVMIGVGLMCAAICWMMQAWLPPAWAFYGTVVVILKIGIVGFWMNSYMGGAVSAIGGALLIGSLPPIRRGTARPIHGALLGLGLVVLMNTRPFEGAVLGLAALLYLGPALLRSFTQQRRDMLRIVAAAGVVSLCGLTFTGYYCWRVTGSPIRMPYQVNRDTYGWPENLAFLPAKHVNLRDKVLQSMYRQELQNRSRYSDPVGIVENLDTRLFDNWSFFIGPVLTIPLVFLPWIARDRRTRPLVWFIAVIAILNLFQLVLYPYHLGPVVPVIFTIVTLGIRHLYAGLSRVNRSRAIWCAVVLPVCLVFAAALRQNAGDWDIPVAYWERAAEPHQQPRADIEAWLSARPKKQLVIVRYAPYHPPNQEWVYNRADIDDSKIVWAREMDASSNSRLLDYFSNREAWLVEADEWPQRLVRYAQATAAGDTVTSFNKVPVVPAAAH